MTSLPWLGIAPACSQADGLKQRLKLCNRGGLLLGYSHGAGTPLSGTRTQRFCISVESLQAQFLSTLYTCCIHSILTLASIFFVASMDSSKPENTEIQAGDGKTNRDDATVVEMTRDEYTLARLGYRQVFVRSFGLFENV